MRRILAAAALLLAVGPTPAQVDHKIVFPLSLHHVDGNAHNNTLVNASYMRWQQIDGDSRGNAHIVKFIRFRQDSFVTSANAVSQTVEAEIHMGADDIASFGNFFSANYALGTTKIMGRKTINLPNWSQLPLAPPKSFDMTFPMDFIGAHQGFLDLVWEMEVWNGSGQLYYHVDADSAPGTASATSTALGVGCTTNTGVFTNVTSLDVTNFDANYSLVFSATGAPAGSPVSYMLGTSDPNLSLGWCAPLRVLPIVTIPIGLANASGSVQRSAPGTNYDPAWSGVRMYSQAIAPDGSQPGLPLAFSNGADVSFPPHAHNVKHIFSTIPFALTGTGVLQGGIVIEISDTN